MNIDLKSFAVALGIIVAMGFSSPGWSAGDKSLGLNGKAEKGSDLIETKNPIEKGSRRAGKDADKKGDNKVKKKVAGKAGAAVVTGVATKKVISNITGD